MVRRFLYKKNSINYALLWSAGNAVDWWDNAEQMKARKINKKEIMEGDIVCFSGGSYGHIAVIKKVSPDLNTIEVVQQNVFNDMRDASCQIDIKSGILDVNHNTKYKIQGFLRFQSTS